MESDGRFVANEAHYKKYAYEVLESHFENREEFECFYDSLNKPSTKDEFLRVTAFYRFLVKKGDWHVGDWHFKDKGVERKGGTVIDYITNSFKVIALFAIIESLLSVRRQPRRDAKQRCVRFFSNLPSNRKEALCHAIKIDRKPLESIEEVVDFLYNLRSEFVHEARFVLELISGPHPVFSKRKKREAREESVSEVRLSINELMEAFEEGILKYFNREISKGK